MSKPETPDDWTELVATRVSRRVKKKLEDHLNQNKGGMSTSAFMRELILRELGEGSADVR